MSRLPENKQHQKHKAHQAGEDPANEDAVRDVADAGYAAADDRDFGAVYANVSGPPLDDYPADDHRSPAGNPASATELVRDRNLSGVVRTIQDEGPPDYEDGSRVEGEPARQAEVAPGQSGLATAAEGLESDPETGVAGIKSYPGQGRFGGRLARYRPLLGILVILAIIGAVAGAGKYFSSLTGLARAPADETQPAAPGLADQASDARLREIQQIQLQITARLGELESDIATLADDNSRQWVTNEAALDDIREQQRTEQALVASRLAAIQQQLATLPVAVTAPEVPADSPAVSEIKSGAQSGGEGGWAVNLASFRGEKQAGDLLETLKRAGIPVEQQTTSLNGDTRYRLRVTGFATREEAKRYASKLDKGLGLGDLWVSRR